MEDTPDNAQADATAGLKDLAGFIVEKLQSARLLEILAGLIAQRLSLKDLEPLIKVAALKLELEREICRKQGMGRYLLVQLRDKGLRLNVRRGKLYVGPRELIDTQTRALVTALREELLRELSMENET